MKALFTKFIYCPYSQFFTHIKGVGITQDRLSYIGNVSGTFWWHALLLQREKKVIPLALL